MAECNPEGVGVLLPELRPVGDRAVGPLLAEHLTAAACLIYVFVLECMRAHGHKLAPVRVVQVRRPANVLAQHVRVLVD